MKEFEDELRSLLRREEAPPGFTARVMARTGARTGATGRTRSRMAVAIAACACVVAGGFEYRQYQGRKASQELLMALEIAGGKLNTVQKKVLELNRRVIHD